MKSYILLPLMVTESPIGIPSLVLKFDIAFLAFVTIGFCPDILLRFSSM